MRAPSVGIGECQVTQERRFAHALAAGDGCALLPAYAPLRVRLSAMQPAVHRVCSRGDLPGQRAGEHESGAGEKGEGRSAPVGDALGALVGGHGHGLSC
ncbi:MAG: hypothetical protein [Podoviridae sp. ctdb7]|nr:MAG: hypothetical protein [Podoviridae sp. ctdb7]